MRHNPTFDFASIAFLGAAGLPALRSGLGLANPTLQVSSIQIRFYPEDLLDYSLVNVPTNNYTWSPHCGSHPHYYKSTCRALANAGSKIDGSPTLREQRATGCRSSPQRAKSTCPHTSCMCSIQAGTGLPGWQQGLDAYHAGRDCMPSFAWN